MRTRRAADYAKDMPSDTAADDDDERRKYAEREPSRQRTRCEREDAERCQRS